MTDYRKLATVNLRIEWNPAAAVVGVYVQVKKKRRAGQVDGVGGCVTQRYRSCWVYLVPMLPIHISWPIGAPYVGKDPLL